MSSPLHRNRHSHKAQKGSGKSKSRIPDIPITGIEEGIHNLLGTAKEHLQQGMTGWLTIEPTEALLVEAKTVAQSSGMTRQEALNAVYQKNIPAFPFRLPRGEEARESVAGVVFCKEPNGELAPKARHFVEGILGSAALMGLRSSSKVHLAVTDNATQAEIFSASYSIEIRLVQSGDTLLGVFAYYAEEEVVMPSGGTDGSITKSGILLPPGVG